jgi:hypothetical protein
MGAVRKRAQLLSEGGIPRSLDQHDEAVLALSGGRIGSIFLAALFAFGRNPVMGQWD